MEENVTSHPEFTALMRAVCLSPADDLPRLVLADWLDEHSFPERAEFVRIGCDLANAKAEGGKWSDTVFNAGDSCECRVCGLRRRERELFRNGVETWFAGPAITPVLLGSALETGQVTFPGSVIAVVRRGMVAEIRLTLAQLVGGPCRRCGGAGSSYVSQSGTFFGQCPDCSGTDRTPGVAKALFAAHPIERVVLSCREPHRGPHGYGWLLAATGGRPDTLPRAIFRHLPPAAATDSLPTADAARDAASDACVAEGRSLAGLPPLEIAAPATA